MRNDIFSDILFYLLQSVKYCIMKILTFHFRKVKTGVLLIRNDNLGDFLISLPVFEQIAALVHSENKTVTTVVSSAMVDFCKKFSFSDHIISLPSNAFSGFLRRMKSYRLITKYSAEKVILFHALGRSGEHDYMALLPESRERYALETMNGWQVPANIGKYRTKFFNGKYTEIVFYDVNSTLQHNETALARCAMKKEFVVRLGNIDCLKPFPSFPGLEFPYFLVAPGSSSAIRQWQPENFALLTDQILTDHPGLTPVFIGSKKDIPVIEKVLQLSCNKEKIIDLCGRTSLEELFFIIENARFLITNDTGPYHIAPLVNTKTYCTGGNWHLGAYGPNPLYMRAIFIHAETSCRRCLENCDKGEIPYFCLKQLTVSMVYDRIRQDLEVGGKQ